MTISIETDRSEVQEALRRLGGTQKDIAAALNISKAAVSLWFTSDVSSPKMDAGITGYVAGLVRGSELGAA